MNLPVKNWHERFRQQSAWTQALRQHLLARLGLDEHSRLLEVGCGTGAIANSLPGMTPGQVYGLDLNLPFLRLAQATSSSIGYANGDALRLPYPAGAFDVVYCHFFLLWIAQPAAALAEMVRVTRANGAVIAFAEPDYGGRIDYPPPLAELGRLQAAALRRQGADPDQGRQLSGLFHAAGLRQVETGVLGGQWQGAPSPAQLASEWDTLQADLSDTLPPARLAELRQLDSAAWQSGQRVLYVPTFYAIGHR